MTADHQIQNKVLSSGLIVFNLEEELPAYQLDFIDLAQYLENGFVLREKMFRETLKTTDWTIYKDKHIAILCSADAIVPTWAYMLIATYLQPIAATVLMGTKESLETAVIQQLLEKIDWSIYQDAKVVVKGCSKRILPPFVYVEVTNHLRPIAQSIMFGEPCSTVPLYKKPR